MKNRKKNKDKVYYDSEGDVLYFGAREGLEEEFVEVAPGVNAELDNKGKIIGVEVLNASSILRPYKKSLVSRLSAIAR